MKYKDKIKEEVERLINDKTDGKHVAKADIIAPKRSAYLDILNFINSLPEEPVNEDLEEELHNFLIEHGPMATLERCAKHFAEWQKEKLDRQFGFLKLKDCKDAYNEWKSTQDNPSAALAWVRACEWQKQRDKLTWVDMNRITACYEITKEKLGTGNYTDKEWGEDILKQYKEAKED